MLSTPYIGLTEKDWNKPIYRIIPVKRFFEMIESKENVLVAPQEWNDPFENLQGKMLREVNGTDYRYPLRDRCYGQCWSFKAESDAMWRIYAPNEDGIRLETTIRRLFTSLSKAVNCSFSCFIGKVEYKTEPELESIFCKNGGFWGGGSENQAKSLLFKREAFQHEAEVRLLFLDPRNEGVSHRGVLFRYDIDPVFFFNDGLMFDPRMHKSEYEALSKFVVEDLKLSVKIGQSSLYRMPDWKISG